MQVIERTPVRGVLTFQDTHRAYTRPCNSTLPNRTDSLALWDARYYITQPQFACTLPLRPLSDVARSVLAIQDVQIVRHKSFTRKVFDETVSTAKQSGKVAQALYIASVVVRCQATVHYYGSLVNVNRRVPVPGYGVAAAKDLIMEQ